MNEYTQSGTVETPDGQLMFAAPIETWPPDPTGMPSLPTPSFTDYDERAGAASGDDAVVVHTGSQYGPCADVTVHSVRSKSEAEAGWEESIDLEFTTPDGQMYLYDMGSFSYATGFEQPITNAGPGTYAMRIQVRGRLTNQQDPASTVPESYLVAVWKTSSAA